MVFVTKCQRKGDGVHVVWLQKQVGAHILIHHKLVEKSHFPKDGSYRAMTPVSNSLA